MDTYIFSNFTHQKADAAFGLKEQEEDSLYQNWQKKAKDYDIDDFEQKVLGIAHKKLMKSRGGWNEWELQIKFIAKVVELVDFDVDEHYFSSFAERGLEQKVNGAMIKGKVDWMVARGRSEPTQPFFFIHEYKKVAGYSGDPAGQLLSTMYVAQLLNSVKPKPTLFNPKPVSYADLTIYGSYIIGQYWRFVVLKDKDYYISESYDSAKLEELYEIVGLLKAQKDMIIDCVKDKVM